AVVRLEVLDLRRGRGIRRREGEAADGEARALQRRLQLHVFRGQDDDVVRTAGRRRGAHLGGQGVPERRAQDLRIRVAALAPGGGDPARRELLGGDGAVGQGPLMEDEQGREWI